MGDLASLLDRDEWELRIRPEPGLGHQALWLFLHSVFALGTWFGLMLIGYAVNPKGIPQWMILAVSLAAPLVLGLVVAWLRPDRIATVVWLIGLIWVMVFSLYLLDLPTGPGRCDQCTAIEKLSRSFLSLPRPSGLMDDDAPFLATWPAAALIGYSIGAWISKRRAE